MHQILHADDAQLPELLVDDLIIGQRDALLVHFTVATLVYEVADCFDGRVAVGDVGFDYFQHFRGCFCEFDEDAVVNLEEAQELEDFAGFGGDFVDTD